MAADTKIIIVEGQEFRVPSAMEIDAIRSHLATTYPSVTSAIITKGKRTIEGEEYETIEFVKKVGTKGLDLVAALEEIPPAWDLFDLFSTKPPVPIEKLLAGGLTFGEAMLMNLDTELSKRFEKKYNREESALCLHLAELPASADQDLPLGW
ncbi:MAG TPA: hypothetical protein DEF47_12460 [Herpetosiphon sp.]|nr:hypothetical protein [Herpetosiphon sp.]HBW50707.1 hypothetical protein [Herpetosiphon sp.]